MKNGTTTVEIDEVEFEIEFEYCYGEEAVIHPVEMCHPGSSPEMTILKVTHGKTDFTDFFYENDLLLQSLASRAWESVEED